MKNTLFIIGCIALNLSVSAQTSNEIFNQKKTQRQYLIEQMAALKVYAGYMKKGYNIAKDGMSSIQRIGNGEFSLHKDFIGSMKAISPAVRKNARFAEILAMQIKILTTFSSLPKTSGLQAADLEYVASVKRRVVADLEEYLDQLILLTTPATYQMDEEHRIERLNELHASVMDTFQFCGSFAADVRMLGASRIKEQYSVNQLNQAYENEKK